MIYFDNAATSYPKPQCVYKEIKKVLTRFGGNPGRGSYPLANDTGRYVYKVRKEIADFLGASKSSQIIFTANATESANVILKGYLNPGEHVIYFSAEHNANFRPLKALELKGIELSKVKVCDDDENTIKGLISALKKKTKLIVAIYGSNVSGKVLPLAKIIKIAHDNGVRVYSDMAQTAGFLPTDLKAMDIDFAAFAGHKSLLGPCGIGILYAKEEALLEPLKTGGTGNLSQSPYQPQNYPAALESGTPNLIGIGGLYAGIKYLKAYGEFNAFEHEKKLTHYFLWELRSISAVEVYGPKLNELRLPVVSLNVKDKDCTIVGEHLQKHGKIAVRTGLHCAPEAHKTI
ncbi:MAG: aminotransferase class V-fold PLP-dependent enzyme, partial [Clostridiales bacterium]